MRRRWSLPLRGWLGVAMVAILITPILSWLVAIIAVQGPLKTEPTPWERRTREQLNQVAGWIESRSADWSSPSFQSELREQLQGSVISVVLMDGHGSPLLKTGRFEAAYADERWPDWQGGGVLEMTGARQHMGLIRDASDRVTGIYVLEQVGLDPFFIVLLMVIFAALTGAMLLTVWWVGRSINRPIEALAQAAKAVSREELEFVVPASRIQEVNQLSTAFAAMRDALRESIMSQAAMEQERKLLIAGIAHDLRTPLASVRGYLEGLRDGIARTPEKVERYVAVALEKTGHLERLIADLFAFAQAEYLNQVPRREAVDLGALLQEAVEGMAPRAASAGVAFRLAVEDVPLQADRGMLTRVVENLLENGVRHTPAGGTVTVRALSEPGGCRIMVVDTGPGIPSGDLERIFEPLYRGDAARGTRTGGAGLGLAIARRFVEAHGGRISAANDGGALFTIWLPC